MQCWEDPGICHHILRKSQPKTVWLGTYCCQTSSNIKTYQLYKIKFLIFPAAEHRIMEELWAGKNSQFVVLDEQFLCIWLAKNIQLYAKKCPFNSVYRLTFQDQLMKTYNRLFHVNPTDQYARQWSSSDPPRSSSGLHIFQMELAHNSKLYCLCQLVLQHLAQTLCHPQSVGFARDSPK